MKILIIAFCILFSSISLAKGNLKVTKSKYLTVSDSGVIACHKKCWITLTHITSNISLNPDVPSENIYKYVVCRDKKRTQTCNDELDKSQRFMIYSETRIDRAGRNVLGIDG